MIGLIIENKSENHFNSNNASLFSNDSDLRNFDYENSCGYNNCPETPLKASLSQPTISSVYTFYVVLCIMAILSMAITFVFTDDLNLIEKKGKISIKLIGKFNKN